MIQEYLLPTFLFFLFCIVHSLMASVRIKQKLLSELPSLAPYYRLIFNLISILFLIGWYLLLPEDSVVYKARGFLFGLMIIAQITFLWLLLKSTLAQYGMTFAGFKQIIDKIKLNRQPGYLDEPERGELITTGWYGKMRHPMYTFVMLILIFSPLMTANLIYTTLIFGLYFWIGSVFEEKNLVKRYGEDYKRYRKEVPRFIPKIFT